MSLILSLIKWLKGLFAKPSSDPVPVKQPPQVVFPLWIKIAQQEIGQHEIAGNTDNPRIIEYLKATDLDDDKSFDFHDEIPWCSAFVNWVMQQAGMEGTHDAMARSWLNWGVAIEEPRAGCVVIFARGSDGVSGHVGFVVDSGLGWLKVLGGNQSDSVDEALFTTARVLGYRWPKT